MLSNEEAREYGSVVSLAQRYIRTPEGAKLFGKPIGSLIGNDGAQPNEASHPVTIERLRSLQRQFAVAKATGNTGIMRDIQRQFIEALRSFRADHQDMNVLKALTGAQGRQAQDAQKAQ